MTDARREELLNGWLDDDLSAAEMELVNERLAADAEWRDELSRMRDLQQRCEALPLSIEPPQDLWPQISRRIGEGNGAAIAEAPVSDAAPVAKTPSRTAGASLRVLLTAASLAAVAVLPLAGPGGGPIDTAGIIPVDYGVERMAWAVDAETRPTRADVADWPAVGETGGEVPAEVWDSMRKDLETVEEAVVEARQAWLADPENSRLAHALSRVCRVRAELVQRARRLSTTT